MNGTQSLWFMLDAVGSGVYSVSFGVSAIGLAVHISGMKINFLLLSSFLCFYSFSFVVSF